MQTQYSANNIERTNHMTLEDKMVERIVELGDGDQRRREQLLEGLAEDYANEFMDEHGLKTEGTLGVLMTAIKDCMEREIDWEAVDAELEDRARDIDDYFSSFTRAVEEK